MRHEALLLSLWLVWRKLNICFTLPSSSRYNAGRILTKLIQTSELHCGNPDPHGKAPCQDKFGLCHVVPSPSCGAAANSANGRTIGYYQASNTRDRLCDRVTPSQINTTGLTHLYFAFAKVDSKSFAVITGNDGDIARYKEFTKLQSSSLKTWIAIGGFDLAILALRVIHGKTSNNFCHVFLCLLGVIYARLKAIEPPSSSH